MRWSMHAFRRSAVLMPLLLVGDAADRGGEHSSLPAAAARSEQGALAGAVANAVPGINLASAEQVPAGKFSIAPFPQVESFCRIQASVTTSSDSRVNAEVWLPDAWNGKVVVTGNGGYSNALKYNDMAHAMAQGYAAVGGDT